jgi:hypothetical protein
MIQELSPLGPVQLEQALEGIVEATRKAIDYGERGFFVPEKYCDPNADEIAKDQLNQAWRILLGLLEAGSHQVLLKQALDEFEQFKKDPLESAMGPYDPYLIWPYKLRQYCDVFEAMYVQPKKKQPKTEPTDLETILERSEKYILSQDIFGWVPCSEADIHGRIEELLGCFFRRILHKPTLPKPIKSFVPDTGLPSIRTLVEYKYVASSEDAKRIVDEILADLGGYQSEDYDRFVFVIYETHRCVRHNDWEDVLNQSKPTTPIRVVLLKGIEPTVKDKEESEKHRVRVMSMRKTAAKKPAKQNSLKPVRKKTAVP